MENRQPTYPGRVLITPESGNPYYATLTRADEPTAEGTPLNKQTLLQDATAALFGLTPEAVPDDVFNTINSLYPHYSFGYYDGTGVSDANQYLHLDFPAKLVVICSTVAVSNVWRNAYDLGIIFYGLAPFANINNNYTGYMVRYGYLYFNKGQFIQDENCVLPNIDEDSNLVVWRYNQDGYPERQFNRSNCRYNYIAFG